MTPQEVNMTPEEVIDDIVMLAHQIELEPRREGDWRAGQIIRLADTLKDFHQQMTALVPLAVLPCDETAPVTHSRRQPGYTKLTEVQVLEIRRAYMREGYLAGGTLSLREIGARYGVTGANIGAIVRGDLWDYPHLYPEHYPYRAPSASSSPSHPSRGHSSARSESAHSSYRAVAHLS